MLTLSYCMGLSLTTLLRPRLPALLIITRTSDSGFVLSGGSVNGQPWRGKSCRQFHPSTLGFAPSASMKNGHLMMLPLSLPSAPMVAPAVSAPHMTNHQ